MNLYTFRSLAFSEEPTNLVVDFHRGNSMNDRGPAPHLPLRKKQRRLVRDNPGSMQAIGRGVKIAISECKYQFKKRRWNCPTTDHGRGKNIFGKIVQRGKIIKINLESMGYITRTEFTFYKCIFIVYKTFN